MHLIVGLVLDIRPASHLRFLQQLNVTVSHNIPILSYTFGFAAYVWPLLFLLMTAAVNFNCRKLAVES